LRDTRPQVVHTHTSKAGIIGRVAARLAGVPAIVHGVHILPFLNVGRLQRLAYLGAERAVAAVTDAFVDVSEGMRDVGLANRVGRPDRHVVIPSGMDLGRFVEAQPVASGEIQAAFARRTPMPDDGRLLVMVAALEVRKRVLEFLDVLATIHSRRPNVFLVVLGEGNERSRIIDRAEALGMADRVALLGYRDNVERWMAGSRSRRCAMARGCRGRWCSMSSPAGQSSRPRCRELNAWCDTAPADFSCRRIDCP
jgi:glycosyltransferase involved in cell wall biosynthesis